MRKRWRGGGLVRCGKGRTAKGIKKDMEILEVVWKEKGGKSGGGGQE